MAFNQLRFRFHERRLKFGLDIFFWVNVGFISLDCIGRLVFLIAFWGTDSTDFYNTSMSILLILWTITTTLSTVVLVWLLCMTNKLHWLMFHERLKFNVGQVLMRCLTIGSIVSTFVFVQKFNDDKTQQRMVWFYFYSFIPILVLFSTAG
jgi:hypothetical protein